MKPMLDICRPLPPLQSMEAGSNINEEGGATIPPAPLRGGRNAAHRLRASPPHTSRRSIERHDTWATGATTVPRDGGCPWAVCNDVARDQPGAFLGV